MPGAMDYCDSDMVAFKTHPRPLPATVPMLGIFNMEGA